MPSSSRINYRRLPRTLSSWILNMSKDGDSATSLDKLFQCLAILTVKKNSLLFKKNFLYFSLWPMTLVHLEHHLEKPGSIFFILPHQVLLYIAQMCLSLLFSRLNHPSSLSLLLYDRYSKPLFGLLVGLLQHVHVLLVLRSPEPDLVIQMWSQMKHFRLN